MSSRRGRRRGQRRPPRAAVINLDGADSSGSERLSPAKPKETKLNSKPLIKKDLHLTLSPDRMCRGIMSDSSDSDSGSVKHKVPAQTSSQQQTRSCGVANGDGSDSSDDIFEVNFAAHQKQVLKDTLKELNNDATEQGKTTVNSSRVPSAHGRNTEAESDDDCLIEDVKTPEKEVISCKVTSPPSPTLFDIKRRIRRKEWNTKASRKKKSAALNQLEAYSKEKAKVNESLNLSSDLQISDGEGDEEEGIVNSEIRVRIKWGSEIFRQPIRRLQKFSRLYEDLAERYRVSADRVVLSFKDRVINPNLCPKDLKITIADTIEGGVQSQVSYVRRQPAVVSCEPDSISLKIQSSQRKGSVTLNLGLSEKMSVLMHKYAEEKQMSLEKLKFMFDGEALDPRSTPKSLDMEGGECIDVYEC